MEIRVNNSCWKSPFFHCDEYNSCLVCGVDSTINFGENTYTKFIYNEPYLHEDCKLRSGDIIVKLINE